MEAIEKSIIRPLMPLAGRNAQGRFTQGNQAAKGRRSTSRNNLEIFRVAISEEDIAQIAKVLKQKAFEGDIAAAKVVLDFCLPKTSEIAMIERKWECEEEAEGARANIGRPYKRFVD